MRSDHHLPYPLPFTLRWRPSNIPLGGNLLQHPLEKLLPKLFSHPPGLFSLNFQPTRLTYPMQTLRIMVFMALTRDILQLLLQMHIPTSFPKLSRGLLLPNYPMATIRKTRNWEDLLLMIFKNFSKHWISVAPSRSGFSTIAIC